MQIHIDTLHVVKFHPFLLQVDVWAQSSSVHHPFVTYYCDVETQEPVRWVFFDGGAFDVCNWCLVYALLHSAT